MIYKPLCVRDFRKISDFIFFFLKNTLQKWRGAQIDMETVFFTILDTPTNGRFSNFDHVDFHACPEGLKTLKKQ